MDSTKIEELEPPMHEQIVQDKVNWGFKHIFEGKFVIAQAQMLHRFLKLKSLRNPV